jgi:uncharacterized protein YoxC
MNIITEFLKLLKAVVTLADDLKRYNDEVKEIRRELRDLTIVVTALAQEVRHSKERAASERANVLLEVENTMLKFERRLPAAKQDDV